MWSILALGAAERLIHHVIDLDAISRIQLNKLQGKMLRVVMDSPQLSVDVFFDENKGILKWSGQEIAIPSPSCVIMGCDGDSAK